MVIKPAAIYTQIFGKWHSVGSKESKYIIKNIFFSITPTVLTIEVPASIFDPQTGHIKVCRHFPKLQAANWDVPRFRLRPLPHLSQLIIHRLFYHS